MEAKRARERKPKRGENAKLQFNCSRMEKIKHSQLCENHQDGNDKFKTHFNWACSSIYSRGSESQRSGMTTIGLTLYWRLMRDFQTKGRGERRELAAAVKLHGLIPLY